LRDDIRTADRRPVGNFLLKVRDNDIERATRQQVSRCIYKISLCESAIHCASGKISEHQAGKEYDKGKNN
jgi:hypothetical protein